MKQLKNFEEEITEVIDGAGIIQKGFYFMSREAVESMALRNICVIPDGKKIFVKNMNGKRILSEGNYLATTEEIQQMILNRIKYA